MGHRTRLNWSLCIEGWFFRGAALTTVKLSAADFFLSNAKFSNNISVTNNSLSANHVFFLWNFFTLVDYSFLAEIPLSFLAKCKYHPLVVGEPQRFWPTAALVSLCLPRPKCKRLLENYFLRQKIHFLESLEKDPIFLNLGQVIHFSDSFFARQGCRVV